MRSFRWLMSALVAVSLLLGATQVGADLSIEVTLSVEPGPAPEDVTPHWTPAAGLFIADPDCTAASDDTESGFPACHDSLDNDGDTKVDYPFDPGCADAADVSEADDCPSGPACPRCANQVDDDGDGHTDYPADPDCTAASDDTESDFPACLDGLDNDGDGKVDYPFDPGCTSVTDPSESDACPAGPGCPQCGNGADDDSDGFIDYPADAGCTSAGDTTE